MALVTDYDVWQPEHDAVTVEAVIANLIKNVATAHVVLGRVMPRVGGPRGVGARARSPPRSSPIPRAIPPRPVSASSILVDRYLPPAKKRTTRG